MNNIEKIINYNFEGQRLLFENSKRYDYERFTIFYLNEFDDDYLNLAINLKSESIDEFESDFYEIKQIMNNQNRKASVLINNSDLINKINYKKIGLEISDDSVWLMIDNMNEFPRYKSDINVHIKKINKGEEKEYPYLVEEGFKKHSELDPYDGLSKSIITAIKRSCFINNQFITEHYVAENNEKKIGTATIMFNKEIAFIYNITTNLNYRKYGVCKELMSYVINRINELNIDMAVLQTEKGFYPEQIYKKMGFKELFRAIKYTETKKFE